MVHKQITFHLQYNLPIKTNTVSEFNICLMELFKILIINTPKINMTHTTQYPFRCRREKIYKIKMSMHNDTTRFIGTKILINPNEISNILIMYAVWCTFSTFIIMIGNGKLFNTLTSLRFRIAYWIRKAAFGCFVTFITKHSRIFDTQKNTEKLKKVWLKFTVDTFYSHTKTIDSVN